MHSTTQPLTLVFSGDGCCWFVGYSIFWWFLEGVDRVDNRGTVDV